MTIRAKVIGSLALLIGLAVVEAGLVAYVLRSLDAAEQMHVREAQVLDLQARAARALVEAKASRRAALLSGTNLLDEPLAAAIDGFDAAVRQARDLMEDGEDRRRLDGLVGLTQVWMANWPAERAMVIERGLSSAEIVAQVGRGFDPIERALAEIESSQRALAGRAQVAEGRLRAVAGSIMLLIPIVAVVVMSTVGVMAGRTLLWPLARLTKDASKIAYGEGAVVAPTTRADEIGILINAFAKMTEAVSDREQAVREALARERQLSAHNAEATAAAERANADLRATIDTIPVALIIRNARGGGIRLQNRAAVDLWGEEPDDLEGRIRHWSLATVRGPDGRLMLPERWPAQRALAGGIVTAEELEIQRPGGPTVPVLVSAAPLRDAHGTTTGAVVAFQDISRMREVDRLKNEFVSIVSHELRTPLTSIRGSLQLVISDIDSVPDPDHRQLLQVALNNCERLIRIINDILDISKIEAGRMALHARPVDVADLVRLSLESVQSVAEAAHVHVDVRLDADLPAVLADPDRMVQVFVNLLSNAIKFTPHRSQVIVHAARIDDKVAVAITDQGPGISEENLTRLFRKFQQVDSSASRRKGGTGLGLAISKALVEQHGGTIEVSSTPGHGTTFTVTVPAAAGLAATRPLGQASSALRPVPKRVLIVDDDDDFRLVVRRQLESAGYLVVEARDGAAALHVARQTEPDIITVDLMMPGMNGWELIDRLSADAALCRTPVIVLSAVADQSHDLPGVSAVLTKPVDREGLLKQMAGILQGRPDPAVLVAEDDADLRTVLAQSLRQQGYRVFEAADGGEALAIYDREPIDAIVLDIRMPNVDGLGVIRSLRASGAGASVPIVVVSGSDAEGRIQYRAMTLGADAYLAKPVDAANLARHIERLLTRDDAT